MFDLRFEGEEDAGALLKHAAAAFPGAVRRGLLRIGHGIEREAYRFLSGSGADAPGSYPVPVRTGHLRRMLFTLGPGQSKANAFTSVTAAADEVIVGDSAEYAAAIHKDRPFLTDGFETFDRALGVLTPIREEIRKAVPGGLA